MTSCSDFTQACASSSRFAIDVSSEKEAQFSSAVRAGASTGDHQSRWFLAVGPGDGFPGGGDALEWFGVIEELWFWVKVSLWIEAIVETAGRHIERIAPLGSTLLNVAMVLCAALFIILIALG